MIYSSLRKLFLVKLLKKRNGQAAGKKSSIRNVFHRNHSSVSGASSQIMRYSSERNLITFQRNFVESELEAGDKAAVKLHDFLIEEDYWPSLKRFLVQSTF